MTVWRQLRKFNFMDRARGKLESNISRIRSITGAGERIRGPASNSPGSPTLLKGKVMQIDSAVIEVDKATARQAFEEYRAAVRRTHLASDILLMRGYKAISEGKKILNIEQVICAHGASIKTELPALAIIRADAPYCWLHWSGQRVWFGMDHQLETSHTRRCISVPPVIGVRTDRLNGYWSSTRAQVPLIPPHLRPSNALSNYHILFEAEWERVPPKDPILLKRLEGPLFVVLAHWNLTELERTVLGLMREREGQS
jgi:hypothetical protein